jgi:hypothetical protein
LSQLLTPLTKIQRLQSKVNLYCIKVLKYVPPFQGIYTELALQLRDIDTLAGCIEALALSITNLTTQMKEVQAALQILPKDQLNLTARDKTKLN